jgi:hypothetical protein
MFSTARLLIAALASAAALLAVSPAAHAATKTTTWYTINVAAPSADQSGLFLGTGPNDTVTLQRYVSGAPQQQWAPVYAEWPGAPRTTSNSPFAELWTCLRNLYCPFSTSTAPTSPRKFVNRLSGRCLTLDNVGGAVRAALARCRWQGSNLREQVVEGVFGDARAILPRSETELVRTRNGRAGCLTVDSIGNVQNAGLGVVRCASPSPWQQRFRSLQVASSTCTPGRAYGICGLPSGWRP